MTDSTGNWSDARSETQTENSYGDSFSDFFCNEPFWNHSRSWDSPSPEFGSCFERTAMVWVPCGFLLLYAPFYVILLRKRPVNPIPWTPLSYSKLVLSLFLIATGLAELFWVAWHGSTYSIAHIIAPVILLITYVTHIALVCIGRLRGERTSGSLWLFWFLMLLFGVPQLITSIIYLNYRTEESPPALAIIYIIQYVVTISIFITNWFADAPSKLEALVMTQKPSKELSASVPNQYLYFYCTPLIWTGYKRPLVFEDLWDIRPDMEASKVSNVWHGDFDRNSKRSRDSYDTGEGHKKKAFVHRRLWRMCKGHLFICATLYALAEIMRLITPQLLSLLMKFITNVDEPMWHGILYAVSLTVVSEASSLMKNNYFLHCVNLSTQVRCAIMSAVYRKALNLSGSSRKEFTIGQIVNMMSVDAMNIGDAMWNILNIVFAPIIILVAMGFLWQKLGPSVLAGLFVLIMLTPVNSYLANKTKDYQTEAIKLRDKRVKMASEIVGGIKVLKLYAWEDSFAKEVQKVRDEEISFLRKAAYLQAFSGFVFNVVPYLVSLATFATFLLVSSDNQLDAELAFVSLALFNIMKLPINQMPSVIAQIIQASVALKRIKKFLAGNEVDLSAVSSDRHEGAHLAIYGGQFSWEGDEESTWALRDIQMSVKPGKLVAVVGSVGAGKSSLISAFLGEIRKDEGKVVVNGNIAYVPQEAWLQNATIRDNITWGQPFSEKWYNKVIEACALLPDLQMLEGGDMTEVGEKGLNLSGGQKQRISLARAVYRDADILLLDDPLSAVDAHVGKHIFEKVIGPKGLLKTKTRMLVTHAVTFLPQVDEVIVVKDGVLVESGPYSELMAADGDFAQFIVQYLTTCSDDALDEDLLEIRSKLENAPENSTRGELLRQISLISSTGSNASLSCKPDHRQRSISECIEEDIAKSQYTTNLQLHVSSGNIPEHQDEIVPLKNISNGQVHSKMGSQSFKGSKSTIASRGSSVISTGSEAKGEAMADGKAHVGALINEELQETGKVDRYIYLVYVQAMGYLFAIAPFVSLLLGQGCVAGGNVWLSLLTAGGDAEGNGTLESTTTAIDSKEGEAISRELFLTGYGLFGVGQAIFIFGGQAFVMLGCLRSANVLHNNLLSSVVRLPMSFFDTNPSGRVINRFSKETSTLDFNLPNTIRALLSNLTTVVTTLLVIVISTPVAAVVLIPIMIVYYLVQVVFVATSRQIKRIEATSKSPIYSHFSESVQGVSVIRAFKRQDEFIQDSISMINRFIKVVAFNTLITRWVSIHLETLGNLITLSAAMLGVLGRETISPGIVGLSVTYALNITMVLNWLVRLTSELESNIVSVERINEYIEKEQEAEWKIKGKEPNVTWPEEGIVSFKHYETRYRPGLDLVLRGITCDFKPSEKVGIVGRTGAGKSSLTLALFRIIESAGGSISIDGVRISDIGLHDLRSRLSIIPQDPVLFSGTLRINLDPFGDHSDADVWRALELAHLKEFVKAQTSGLQYTVDENGSNFSVGQRQLVCLARALLRQSKILVLDEATAAVDLETDDFIQATIREQFKDSTIVTIAHRINTILDYDRVLVLDQGQIAEFDTPNNLLANSDSIFHGMAKDAGLVS